MSARILYSLTDDKAGGGGGGGGGEVHKHIGCMNGIFQLFDRSHFLSGGRRLAGSGRKRLTAGQNENYGAEEDTMSIKSTGKVSKAAAAKERHRLSTDSSRSSASSSCNSSSFSSIEDHKPAKMEQVNSTENRAKDLPRLQQSRNSNDSCENTLPKSGTMMYVDSPRPVLPSKVTRERNSSASESLRDLRSLSGPRNFVDSPRFSYDGRESRDEIKSSVMKLREQPRHSLDSKRSSLTSLSLKVQQQQEDPGSHKWQSSVVAKLMGLETAACDVQVSSKPQMGHGRNSSVDALDPFSVLSRTANDYKQEANANLVVRLKQNADHVLDKLFDATKESPLQSPTLSVYGELEKRLEQIEFKRSGKDLRALKQILEAMQRSEQPEEDRKKIHRVITERNNIGDSEFTAKFANHSSMKSAGTMTSHEVGSPISLDNLKRPPIANATIGFVKEQIPPSRNRIPGIPKIQVLTKIQRNSSDQQRTDDLTPRASPRQGHYMSRSGISTHRAEDRRQISQGNIPGRNFGDSSPRPLRKKFEPTYCQNRPNHPGRQPREAQSPCRAPKSKVRGDLSGGSSRKLTERSNRISTQSDDEGSLASRDEDTEVTSSYVAKSEQTAKVLSQSKLNEESPSEFGTTLAEQPSPVSVLDSSYLEDESPSPVKITSEAFRDDEALSYHGKGRSLHASGDLFPGEKHCKAPKKPQTESTHSEHTYILKTLSSSRLLGSPDAGNLTMIRLHPSGAIMTNLFTTLGHDKLSDNLLPGEDLGEGCLDQSQSKHRERIQRKLLFDVIDEILVQKLTSDNHGNPFLPHSLAAKKTGQEQLLKGLRSEIAHLQADNSKCDIHDDEDENFIKTILWMDLLRESPNWKGCYDDSGIVLDIERLIFKDLVTEVVTGDAAGLRNSQTSYCRQMALK